LPQRSRGDTLKGDEWRQLLDEPTIEAKARWLEGHRAVWKRKTSEKVRVSRTFPKLAKIFEDASSLSVGAGSIPICLIPQTKCGELARQIQRLYRGALDGEFVAWLASGTSPLIVVWITGFKPRGDDSRPDRGLVPLARMLFGDETRILSIVSGPGKAEMWRTFRRDPAALADVNGLWEAVHNLSDAILADSATLSAGPCGVLTRRNSYRRSAMVAFSAVTSSDGFSEHDVDSALHLLFSRRVAGSVFEAMCNPPGGDWSGVTLRNFQSGAEYRWTSLPRVSGKDGKRPDHVIQFSDQAGRVILAAIESKDTASKLEERVGPRMKKFMHKLCASLPTISKPSTGDWSLYDGAKPDLISGVITVGAFCWSDLPALDRAMQRGHLDAALAFEFNSGEKQSLLHIKTRPDAGGLVPILRKAAEGFSGRFKVQIH